MKTSPEGLHFIAAEEGFVDHVYKDTSGYDTIGYGHRVMPGEVFEVPMTQQQALDLKQKDLRRFEAAVNTLYGVPQEHFDALVSFAYNVGVGAFTNSGVYRRYAAGQTTGAADALLVWCKALNPATKKKEPNLTLAGRRWRERALFLCVDGSWAAYQKTLAGMGMYAGKIDGKPGPQTAAAVARMCDHIDKGGTVPVGTV